MRTDVGHDLLRAVGRALYYPPVTVANFQISGDRDTWSYAIGRTTSAERVTWLLALHAELLSCTEGARARLAIKFHDMADPTALVVGDPEALPVVQAAVSLLPAQVRASVIRECAFVAVGYSSRAWTGSANLQGVDGTGKSRLIVLGPKADVPEVLHETAHCFTSRLPSPTSQTISILGEQGLARLLDADESWRQTAAKHTAYHETIADGLALCWLLGPIAGATKPS